MRKDTVENRIVDIIQKRLGKEIKDLSANIFSQRVTSFEFLYVVKDLETEYDITAEDIFSGSDYTIMTLNHLSEKIQDILLRREEIGA